jgi:hypothetical protein
MMAFRTLQTWLMLNKKLLLVFTGLESTTGEQYEQIVARQIVAVQRET